jgi:hypothetical protein
MNNKFEEFEGEFIHPALDIKNGVLCIGFRYLTKSQEEKNIIVVVYDNEVQIADSETLKINNRLYYFEVRGRKLIRIDERWSVADLKQFIADYTEAKTSASIKPQEVFLEIVELVKKHIELEQDIDYFLLAAWIIGTYFYPIFSAYSFLHIKAPKRSGKSQCLNILTQLCFNAVKARPSLPALGDTVDSLRGTYLIDQADSLGQKGTEELLDVLADSYKKSGGKRRIINFDKKRGREILEFETYSPKGFASIKELPEDLRDRCLLIPLIRSDRNFPDPDDSIEQWRAVRSKLYKLLITEYTIVSSDYTVKKINHREKNEVLGRSLELWLPFEIIMDCFGMQDKVQESWKRFSSQYNFTEYEPAEIDEDIIKVLLQQLENKAELILAPKEIAELMDSDLFQTNDTKQKANKIGWTLKRFNLFSEKLPRSKNGVRYLFKTEKVRKIYASYFKGSSEPIQPTPLTPEASDPMFIVENEV